MLADFREIFQKMAENLGPDWWSIVIYTRGIWKVDTKKNRPAGRYIFQIWLF